MINKILEEAREKTLSQVAPHLSYFNDCKVPFAISECKSWINKIFDDIEESIINIHACRICIHCYYDNELNYFACRLKYGEPANDKCEKFKKA